MLKKYISAVIFWGALWGLEEATLGHLLHITAFNIGWFIWFPFAYFFMGMVYKQTGRLNSVLFTSMVAAAIKFINFFMTANLVIVICPAISILLEGLSLFAILKLLVWKKYTQKLKLIKIASVSLLWRCLFLIALLVMPAWLMPAYPYKDIAALLKFVVYEGLINSIFIYGILMAALRVKGMILHKNKYSWLFSDKLIKSGSIEDISFRPIAAFSLLAVALILQRVL